MAKLVGPLHSLRASGTLGSALQYTRIHGRPIAKRPPHPTTPPSPAQISRRALYQAAVAAWHTLTPTERRAYEQIAAARAITTFNAFLSTRLKPPPIATGTTWDNGATTWDSGTTTWDTGP